MKRFTVSGENAMMKTTSAPPAKAGISRTGMSKAYDSRRKELKLRMKKWMKICLMAAASAMLLAGCGTKDNTAETTAVETTAKAEDTKETETEKAEETTRAAASETAETTEAAEENSELDLAAAAGKHHVEITVKDYGTINVELDGDAAPITVANFLDLAGNGFYDGLTFHRIISGFMIQGGCPQGTGMGGPGYSIKGEFTQNGFQNDLLHDRGVLSMARAMNPNSAGSQFFVMVAPAPHLDGQYAAFGKITEGQDVAIDISRVPRNMMNDMPKKPVVMATVRVDTQGVEYPAPETP